MEKIAVFAPIPSANERIAKDRYERSCAQLAYREADVLGVSGGRVPRARPLRHLTEGGRVQRVECASTRVGLACAITQRCGTQVGKMTGKLLHDAGRQLTPFAIGALANQLSPFAQVAITHTRLRQVRE
jgi:hypothetical protein